MERKMLTRYLILIIALTIFAGAAWYFTQDSGTPQAGAVLAGLETQMPEMQPAEMQERISEMQLTEMQLRMPKMRPTEVQPQGAQRPLWEEALHEL